mgnify:CR=1 FL=1
MKDSETLPVLVSSIVAFPHPLGTVPVVERPVDDIPNSPDLSFWRERHRPRGYQACTGDCRSSSASLRPVPDFAATRFPDERRRRDARSRMGAVARGGGQRAEKR